LPLGFRSLARARVDLAAPLRHFGQLALRVSEASAEHRATVSGEELGVAVSVP
jgi:hypothetical protein